MDISKDEIHPHCLKCIKLQKCSVITQPGESCQIISCPLECGAKFHACKINEHQLLCMNEKVPCINSEYGCPAFMCRKYRSKHLISCPASIIHCSEEWDRWPIHFHDKRMRYKNAFDVSLLNHLDVALAMRDQRMLMRWCNAAAQGHSLSNEKFTISPSSSLWIFRKWQSSREYSYPPGLEQSVCNELCKACKNTNTSSSSVTHCKNITRTGIVLDSFCLDYNSLAEKENAGDSNNKQENFENNLIISDKIESSLKAPKSSEMQNNYLDFPQYNLDDVLQLSQFGTIVYHNSSGEGSIRVAVDSADSISNSCFDQQNVACQILDFKFRNPSSTPPWCLPLGLDLNLESRSQHPPSNFMYTFLCSQEFRRDEYEWHYKNAHSEIHGGLNGWLVERCPLAQYGCKFARQRFSPSPASSYLVYNEVLESFGVASRIASIGENCDNKPDLSNLKQKKYQNGYRNLNLLELPFDVLQHIVLFLDSFSLSNLSLTSQLLRDICSSVLKERGLVHFKWERHKKDGKYFWRTSKYRKWFFSSHFSPVHKWTFDGTNNMANHLKVCSYYDRISPKYPFDYMKGPAHVHPNPEKCFADPSKENSENTTKL